MGTPDKTNQIALVNEDSHQAGKKYIKIHY